MEPIYPTQGATLAPTIFHEPWWLDIASKGQWREVVVIDQGDTIGRLPYQLSNTIGIKRGTMPQFTHFLGPAVNEGLGSADTRFLKKLATTRALIKQLPPMASFSLKCHRDITDAIAFQIEGFRVSVQYTHEIEPQPHDVLWTNMHHKKRSVITRAQKRVSISTNITPEAFCRFYQNNLDEKKIKSILDLSVCEKLIAKTREMGMGQVWSAHNAEGTLDAAIFCVWDKQSCYYLMTTRRNGTHTGVISLLVWEAIKHASSLGLIFDFDGLISEGSVYFSCDFGATVSPRYIVTKENRLMKLYKAARSLFEKENCFA